MRLNRVRLLYLIGLLTGLLIVAPNALAQSACKGLSSGKCSGKSNCVWVKGYTRKDNKKVQGYCRAKGGSGSKSGSSKTGSAASASSKKTKAGSNKTGKNTSTSTKSKDKKSSSKKKKQSKKTTTGKKSTKSSESSTKPKK